MTVCDLCKGTGRLLKPWYDTTGAMMGMTGDICFMCDGTGEITQTNEEWLHTLNTEQKAEWLTNVINTNPCGYLLFCDECSLNDKCKEDDYPTNTETWVEWLKQPHREERKK